MRSYFDLIKTQTINEIHMIHANDNKPYLAGLITLPRSKEGIVKVVRKKEKKYIRGGDKKNQPVKQIWSGLRPDEQIGPDLLCLRD